MRAKDLTDGKEPVSHAEVDYLKELASTLPENPVIVNIGAATGVSTLAFLEERADCFICSVDINECKEEFEHVKQAGRDVRQVVRLLGDSKLIGPKFPYKCNMLFVDGDHWNAAGDIAAWVETGKVKSGGVIAFHDFIVPPNPPNNPGDVYNQVKSWSDENPEYEQLGWVDRVIAFRMP